MHRSFYSGNEHFSKGGILLSGISCRKQVLCLTFVNLVMPTLTHKRPRRFLFFDTSCATKKIQAKLNKVVTASEDSATPKRKNYDSYENTGLRLPNMFPMPPMPARVLPPQRSGYGGGGYGGYGGGGGYGGYGRGGPPPRYGGASAGMSAFRFIFSGPLTECEFRYFRSRRIVPVTFISTLRQFSRPKLC